MRGIGSRCSSWLLSARLRSARLWSARVGSGGMAAVAVVPLALTFSGVVGPATGQAGSVGSALARGHHVVLTVALVGDGHGTVAGRGLTCSSTGCTGTYRIGATVTLSATPDARSRFSAWTGCTSSSDTSCVVTVSQATTVTATFVADPVAPFLGSWVNVDPTDGTIDRAMLARNGSDWYTAILTLSWRSCADSSLASYPVPAYGAYPGLLLGGTPVPDALVQREFELSLSGDQLVIGVHTHLLGDVTGGFDYEETDVLNRS